MNRVKEIDFVKGVMITCMVFFHVNFIGSSAEYCLASLDWLYSFLIPIFFFLTGYFTKDYENPLTGIRKTLQFIVLPYLIFSSVYISLIKVARLSGVNLKQPVDFSSLGDFLEILFIKPPGAGWYLFFIAVYRLSYYLPALLSCCSRQIQLLLHFLLLFELILSPIQLTVITDNAHIRTGFVVFLLLGYIFGRYRISLPRGLAFAVPLPVMLYLLDLKDIRANLLFHVFWVMCILGICTFAGSRENNILANLVAFVGRHTLGILVLHIFFLNAIEYSLENFIAPFDPTGLNYVLFSTMAGVFLPIYCLKIMDRLGVSRFCFGRNGMYMGEA